MMAHAQAAAALGAVAALCSVTSFVPQVVKIVRDRDAAAVSLRMYAITVTGFALWTVYGWILGEWPLIAANAISLMLSSIVLALKIRFTIERARSRRTRAGAPDG